MSQSYKTPPSSPPS
uniref:Uncharacterized protein n=1 Tax=Rhizophora mucronata TaxID=61149 RepID=A0A2P2J021_RHIMU